LAKAAITTMKSLQLLKMRLFVSLHLSHCTERLQSHCYSDVINGFVTVVQWFHCVWSRLNCAGLRNTCCYFICSILSSCHEKATVALCFGRILSRL